MARTRAELEDAIETESTRERRAIGWGCDAIYRDADGNTATADTATHVEVTTFNDEGFHEVVNVPMSEGKTARELSDEFLQPTIEEVDRRRSKLTTTTNPTTR